MIMNKCFDKIYLSWRIGKGYPRIMVGMIEERSSGVIFRYLREGVDEAVQYGFRGYPGLSLDQTFHDKNVIELFSKRIINFERNDTKWLLDFWEVDESLKGDVLYMLAMTQGKMQTDSFEFLASFIPDNGLSFVTDIAAITHYDFNLEKLQESDRLTFKKEPDNPKDEKAIQVCYKNEFVGYIKKGHNEVFWGKCSDDLKIEVKSITNTPSFKELYVKIFNEK
ncbi:HIRAN domain-containing protein [Parabacteroides distasonis]|uniref:HIRAN domain-containing protein n=1 Tax=Parabacteroides distasonis TaxID=823 RepID=UPI0039B5CBCC